MGEYASKGVAGAGLGLGIADTALGVLSGNSNILGVLFGNNNTATTAAMGATNAVLAEKDAEIAKLTSEKYTDEKTLSYYDRLRNETEKVLNSQEKVFNASLAPIVSDLTAVK